MPQQNHGTIVITDGYTLNPGDLDWQPFHDLGPLRLHERTPASEVSERCKDATVIITNKTPISETVIAGAKHLKVIAVTATGYNIVDTDAASKHGVLVCNVPGYGTDSVAQHTFALILELSSAVGRNSASVASGGWSSNPDFCYSVVPLIELSGKTLGIVGYGTIGKRTAEIARAFGMNILYNSPSLIGKDPSASSVEEIFIKSDFISLHCPLTNDNREFVNRDLLSRMKPTAFLINTARGQLIREPDLCWALEEGIIAGAGLDVLSAEPPPADHPLIGLPNCIITPHNAWFSIEARSRIMETTFANVVAALSGRPQNVVNKMK